MSSAHVAHAAGVKPGRGLVEQEQLGFAQQRRRDPEALAHPVRVAADAVLGPVGELDRVERRVDPRPRVAPVEGGQQLEVAPAVQVRVERRRLDESGDALERVDRQLRVAAEQPHAARGGPDQAEHHPQPRRLAGAVRVRGSRTRRRR